MSTPNTQQYTLPNRGTFYNGVFKGAGEPFTLPVGGSDEPPQDALIYPSGVPYWTPEKKAKRKAEMALANRKSNARIAADIRAAELGSDFAAMPTGAVAAPVPTPTGPTHGHDTNSDLAKANFGKEKAATDKK